MYLVYKLLLSRINPINEEKYKIIFGKIIIKMIIESAENKIERNIELDFVIFFMSISL